MLLLFFLMARYCLANASHAVARDCQAFELHVAKTMARVSLVCLGCYEERVTMCASTIILWCVATVTLALTLALALPRELFDAHARYCQGAGGCTQLRWRHR